jgi:hypothetical protein
MAKRRSQKLLGADEFRATVMALMCAPDIDWTDWEEKWLRDESRRPDDYVYTDTEREILNQLIAICRSFTHYSDYSAQELLLPTYSYCAEFNLDDEGSWCNYMRATQRRSRSAGFLVWLICFDAESSWSPTNWLTAH